MEEFTEGRYLCYGDRIIFEITELEGCDLGGVLGVQELKYSNDFLNLPGTSSSKYYNNNKKVTIAQQFSENSNDVTRKRNFGFASISEKNGVYQPPTGFFLNNVFGIVAGVGFEAEGEPVYYGSQIKLTLSSTQEYLFAGNDQIDLMRKEDYDKFHLKECNFKIKPRHGVRLDGDRVFYNDLIVLVDYKGRELLPLSKNRIVLRPNVHHNHGLRIGLYLSAGSILPEAVHGGDVLQLYHKVECSYLVASPLLEDPSKVDIASHQVPDKKFLENSVSLWQVETIPYGEKRLKLSGPVFQGTPIRLRHIMSDKLLKYSDGHFSMVDTPFEYNASAALTGGNTTEDPTMFEFRVNIDALHEEDTVGVSGLRITFDSMVRLYHPASNSYLILRKDAKSSSKKFLASSVNFDRDVFQLLPISSKLLEIVLTAKRLKKGMSLVYEKLNLPNQPKFERVTLLQLASRFFALCVGEHSFLAREERASTPSNGMAPAAADGHESHGLNFDIQSVSHLIANEFGFVEILLQIANKAFQSVTSGYNTHHTSNNNLKLSESEELLAKSAYIGLASLLKMDSSSIYPLLKSGGVPQMIQHFLIIHPNLSWNPPLLEYADAVNKECMKTNSTILVFNEDEIKSLLDKVYNQLSEGFTPTTFVYRLLAKACFGNANLLTNRLNGMNINKRMQMMIAEQLFGSPHETIVPSPQWSMMFYRTVLEEKKEFPRNKRNNHNNNSDSSVRPSTSTTGNGNNQPSENNPPASSDNTDDHQQHQEPKLRKKPYNRRFNLKITTSLIGQIRPHYTDASNMAKITLPIFPPVPKPSSREGGEEGNNPANSQHNESNQNIADLFESPEYSDAEIYEAIQIRNQYFSAHEAWKNSQDVEMKLQSLGYSNDSKVSIIIKQICKSTDWYTITDLRNEQLQFFAVSIQLLSALCIGRNLWCQRIIRHLLPVDHLLFFMDTMKNHSSLTNPYEISSPEMAHLILSVKTMMVSLLHTCYIDSAFSPSYEINPQETMFMMTSIYQMKNKKFYDVFHEECSLKVFALFSQIDKNDLLELSLEMSKEDITTCINHLPLDNATFYSFLKLMKFQCVENDQEIHEGNFDKKLFLDEILSIINIRDNLKTIQLQSNGSIGRGQYPLLKKIKEFKDKLIKLRKFLKVYYAEKAIHCVEQRTLLKKILLDFIHNESFPIWLNSVQLPLAKLMESKDHPAFESPQNTINNSTPTSSSGGGGAGAGAGGSTKLGSSKEVSIMNLNDYDDMEEEIREIRKHIHYLESMFALMKSLMLRGFFNIEYNVNPIYFNESGEEKLFYSKYDERSFLCYPALTYDERQILVMKCVVDPKAKKMNGRYNRDKEKRSLRLSLPFFQSKENNQEKEKKKKKSSASPHHSDDDDEDDDEEDNDEENDLPTSPELGGDLKILREIIENILKILSVRPGKDLPLTMCNINEDEKNIDEYYNRQYGYILDRYHLMKGVMETKLTCCKVLSTIIDVMQVTTEKELEKIFNVLFDRMLEKKESQPTQSQGTSGGPSSSSPQRNNSAAASTAVGNMVDRSDSELFTNNLKRFQSFMQKSVSLFKHEDLKEFTKQLKLLLKSSLSRNYDLIWHVRELFREETFHILLSQIYDNNPFLRAEILNLIYRINARRSELNEVLLREIKLTKEIYNPTTLFLNRQRMYLLDILSHFDQCFDLTIPSYQRVRGNNNNKKDKEKDKEMVSPHRILAVMKKIKFYTLKLKKLLLNNDEHSGELGLINYCYYDLDTEEMLLIRRSALEFSANSPMLNTFGSMTAGSDSPNISRQPTRKKLTTSSFAARIEQARQEEKANESSPAGNNPLKKVLFKNLGKGNNNNNEEKDNNNNNNDEEGDDGGEEIETPKISVNSTIEDILLLPINEDHQRDMFPFNFHKIVIDFIVTNQVSFNAESSMYQYYLSTLSDENSTIELNIDHFPSLSVISHLLMFIRAYINGSVKNLRSILSKKFITALFEMRYCVKESLDLIIELLKKPSTQHIVLEFIEDRNFHALLNDIKFIIQFPEKFIGNTNASSNNLNNSTNLVGSSQQRRNIFGACQIEKLSELLQYLLISSNAKSSSPSASNPSASSSSHHSSGRKGNGESSNTSSSSFMNFFLAMLNEMITYYNRDEDYFTNQLAFQRLLSIGVDIESQANEHQTALTASIAQAAGIRGVTSHSESSSSSSSLATSTAITFPTTQFTRLDIKRTCHRYQKETNRITFSRLSKDILADPLLNESIYIKLRKALELWKLLPTQSIFQLHLDLVELIANSALHSITLQDVYRQAFLNNYHFIFELLFIDKLEIRFAYLQFLNGIWFSRQIEEKIVVPTEFIMAKKIQMNMKALLKLCIQDIKLFLFIIQDVDINYYGEFPSNNNSNNNNSNNSNNNSASNNNTPVKNNNNSNQVSTPNSKLFLSPGRSNLLQHVQLLEKYLIQAVIPFLLNFFKSNFYEFMISSSNSSHPEDNSEGEEDNLPKKSKKPENNTAPSTISSGPSLLSPIDTKQQQQPAAPPFNSNHFPSLVNELSESLADIVQTVGGNFLSLVDVKGLATMFKTLREESRSTTTLIPSTSSISTRQLNSTQKCIRFLMNREKYIRTFGSANANTSSVGRHLKDFTSEDEILFIKRKCLNEFIPEVDQFALTYGYGTLDHLVRTPNNTFYLFDREYARFSKDDVPKMHHVDTQQENESSNSGGGGSRKQKHGSHLEIDDTKYQLVSNPLNCETFRFTEREISKFIVGHCYYKYSDRFLRILKLMDQIPNNQEDEFKFFWDTKYQELEDLFRDKETNPNLTNKDFPPSNANDDNNNGGGGGLFSSFFAKKDSDSVTSPYVQGSNVTVNPRLFSEYCFARWNKYGGLLIAMIFEHLQYSILCYKGEKSLYSSSIDLNDLTKCNSYWINTFTKGLLKSKINYLFDEYAEQTEIQLMQLEVEGLRLSLIQDILCDIGATNLIIRQLSLPESMLHRIVSPTTIESIYSMAIDFGAGLNQNGNMVTQSLFIDTIEQERILAIRAGYENHSFIYIIRGLLQRYSILFQTRDGLTTEAASKCVALLRFLQLLCERHNSKAQNYFGENKIVIEVAGFVNDLSLILSQEMNEIFLTDEELLTRDQPIILGFRRPVIRWINPLPDSFRVTNSSMKNVPKLRPQSNSNHVGANGNRIHPVEESPTKLEMIHGSNSLNDDFLDGDDPMTPVSRKFNPPPPTAANNSNNNTNAADGSTNPAGTSGGGNGNSPKKSSSSSTKKAQATTKFLDLSRLQLLCEVMNAGLQTLTEFNQGPRPEIQLMMARTGVTSEFNTFFKFFGAFHLFTKVDFETKTNLQKKQFHSLYQKKVKARITCETLLSLDMKDTPSLASSMPSTHHFTSGNSSDVYWIGNDPLANFLILSSISEDRHGKKHKKSNNNKDSPEEYLAWATQDAIDGIQQYTEENFSSIGNLCYKMMTCHCNYVFNYFITEITGGDGDILDLEKEFSKFNLQRQRKALVLEDIQDWAYEKHLYLEYRKKKSKMAKIMQRNIYEDIDQFENILIHFEESCIKFLSSLIEGISIVDKDNIEIPTIIFNDIEKENIVCNMSNFWNRYLHYNSIIPEDNGKENESYEWNLAYNYLVLVSQFLDLGVKEITTDLDELFAKWQDESEIILDDYIGRIEVRSPVDSKSLVVTYFPIPQLIKTYWNRSEIEEFRDHILYPTVKGTRDSIDEKVKNFLRDGRKLILTLRHLESLDEIIAPQSFIYRFFINIAHNFKRWNMLCFIFTLALNMLLILSVKLHQRDVNDVDHTVTNINMSGTGENMTQYYIHGKLYERILFILGWCQLLSTTLTVYSFMIMFGWLYIKMGLKENENNQFEFHGFYITKFVKFAYDFYLLGRRGSLNFQKNHLTLETWTVTAIFVHLFSHGDSIYFMALFFFSLLGNLRNPLFYALCLMEVLRSSKLMLYVSRAFTVNIGQVIATVALAAILLYLFTTYAFSSSQIRNHYELNGMGTDGCYSLQECFRMHLDYGLLQSVFWDYPTEIQTAEGQIYNFLFTFIMQIVIPGLISGIIIDTFSQMRQDKQDIEDDVCNTCFICNIDREDFESMNISFEDHIRHDHNLWKYLWFNIYLFEKDITEFDGIESYCHAIIGFGDFTTRWLPIKMARSLSTIRDKYDLFTIYNKITTLQVMIDKFTVNMKGDLYRTEKHVREAIKDEMSQIEKDTKEILGKLEKKVKGGGGGGGGHHSGSALRAGKKSSK